MRGAPGTLLLLAAGHDASAALAGLGLPSLTSRSPHPLLTAPHPIRLIRTRATQVRISDWDSIMCPVTEADISDHVAARLKVSSLRQPPLHPCCELHCKASHVQQGVGYRVHSKSPMMLVTKARRAALPCALLRRRSRRRRSGGSGRRRRRTSTRWYEWPPTPTWRPRSATPASLTWLTTTRWVGVAGVGWGRCGWVGHGHRLG